MATNWTNSAGGDWTNAANWSGGEPTSGTDATIGVAGGYTVTLIEESGAANSLTINDTAATLSVRTSGGASVAASLAIGAGLVNSGTLDVDVVGGNFDGGSSLTIGGTLTNAASGVVNIGNDQLSASTTVSAAGLANSGSLNLEGNGTSGTTEQATLAIAGAAPSTLSSAWFVGGDADLVFGGGGITGITSTGSLVMVGAQARISLGAATSSTALTGLSSNAGLFQLRGDLAIGNGGAVVTTTTSFVNSGTLDVDVVGGNFDGGSSLTIGGTLTNAGSATLNAPPGIINIGSDQLSAPTTVSAAGLVNSGTLNLQGNATLGTTEQATLAIAGAAPLTLSSAWFVGGDADLVFGGGGITGITSTGSLVMVGAQARISLGAATSSTALTGLSSNAGLFQLRGDLAIGNGGAVVTTTTSFVNSGTLDVDVVGGNFDGGSSLTIGGTLTNAGSATLNAPPGIINIGSDQLSAPTTVSAAGLVNSGTLNLQGNGTSGTTEQATLAIAGAAPSTLSSAWFVGGDADLVFGGGGITGITSTGSLVMVGAQARISLGAATSSTALTGLSSNAGLFQLRGDLAIGNGGAVVTTTTSFVNSGTLDVDVVGGNFDGGSSLTIGGTLTNAGSSTVSIGNNQLSAPTTVAAAGLVNSGSLTLEGNATLGTTEQATLAIAGAAPSTLSSAWFVGGDADLVFGGGGITGITSTGSLVMVGAQARISLGAATSSTALTGLSSNAGLFQLRGDLAIGNGGAVVTTTTSFVNSGTLDVDVVGGNFDGGSSLTIGGTLTNAASGVVNIGNNQLSAPTTVAAAGLVNSGTLNLQGNGTSGTTEQATLAIAGAAPSTLSSAWFVGGDADLVFGGGGITGITSTGSLVMVGAQARISLGAATSSTALTGLSSNAGLFQLRGDLAIGNGGAVVTTTTSFVNSGTLDVDVVGGNFDGGSSLTIGGTLTNATSSTVSIGNNQLSAPTTVAAAGLVNSGSLTLEGNATLGATEQATLAIAGAATDPGAITLGGDALLSAGSLAVQSGGSLTVGNFGTIVGTAANGIDLQAGGTVINASGGLIKGLTSGFSAVYITGGGGAVTNSGNITGSVGISINAANTGGNTIVNFGTITGTSGTAINLGTVGSALVVIGSTNSSLQGVVTNMLPGDAFDLPFLPFTSGTATVVSNGTVSQQLQIVENGGTFAIALDPNQNFSSAVFQLGTDTGSGTLVTEAPCFCRGTLILTERGEVPIESLAIGDRVMTISGGAKPIRWIGRRSYDGRFVAGNRDVLPIRVAPGALADGVPRRDLWISPNHALYLEEVLIEMRDLVNGVSISQAGAVEAIEYFNIELDGHDVIVAEGVQAETFIDDNSRGLFHNAHEYRVLYPAAPTGLPRYCAPRRDQGYEVERARATIARRAGLTVPAEAPALGLLRGQIEEDGRRRICGWAQDSAYPEASVCLDIFAGGQRIGQVVANRYRADLAAAGLSSGRHGFEFVPPSGLAFTPRSIQVRRSLDGASLTCSKALKQSAARRPRNASAR